jgi:hypothetical protein
MRPRELDFHFYKSTARTRLRGSTKDEDDDDEGWNTRLTDTGFQPPELLS